MPGPYGLTWAWRPGGGVGTIGKVLMHLPDAFLDAKTIALTAGAAALSVGYAVRHAKQTIEPRQVPMLGLAGAFVFAAQMLNFPIPGGTSGHLIGGVLTSILLGPAAAILVITCVLLVQCLMFADGGLLALGANVFNMAVVSVCGGFMAYRAVKRLMPENDVRGTVFGAAFGGWAGTVLGSLTCAGQLALSGKASWGVVFPAMANVHMLIGIGEGLATALIVLGISRSATRATIPGLAGHGGGGGLLVPGLLVALGLAIFVAPFACPWPDGLEKVAESLGIVSAHAPALAAPMPDYELPFVKSAAVATSLAGVAGTLVVFAAAYLLARILVPGLNSKKPDATTGFQAG